jgi:hypothetical protein
MKLADCGVRQTRLKLIATLNGLIVIPMFNVSDSI